ncbi:MAG: histidine triad nucleotide-binding protein [Oscillospiraceae bacterium]
MDCIFCKIINGDIPSTKVYEDEMVYAFKDISPQAPIHVLVIPKKHIESTDEINETNSCYISKVFEAIPKIASSLNLKNGYRIITNTGDDAKQTVKHIHFHILGGKAFEEKMV